MAEKPAAEVRNPLITLPTAKLIAALPDESKKALRELLMELSKQAAEKAQYCWRKHKAPMAVYWKAVSVYARHTARLLRK